MLRDALRAALLVPLGLVVFLPADDAGAPADAPVARPLDARRDAARARLHGLRPAALVVSLDEPLPDGNGTLGDYIPDDKPSIEDIYADRDLLKHLIARFRELDPDADRIIQMRLDNPKISDRKIAEALGRPQRTFADQMKRYYTELHKIENK